MAHGLSQKAFGNWRAKFKAEPQAPTHKLLYRRGGVSHTSQMTYLSLALSAVPIVPYDLTVSPDLLASAQDWRYRVKNRLYGIARSIASNRPISLLNL